MGSQTLTFLILLCIIIHFIHSYVKNVSVWDPTAHFKHCYIRICVLEGPKDDSIRIETCCLNAIINIIKFFFVFDTSLYIYICVKHFGMGNIKEEMYAYMSEHHAVCVTVVAFGLLLRDMPRALCHCKIPQQSIITTRYIAGLARRERQ